MCGEHEARGDATAVEVRLACPASLGEIAVDVDDRSEITFTVERSRPINY